MPLVAGLTLTACSGGKQETPSAGGSAEVGTTNDINPQDVAALQQGGNLRLALTAFPENFNSLHIDGNSADSAGMLKASMPRAFRIAADGSMTLNTDYFTGAELTSTNPQVVTWTINPKAVWSDGTPITWEDIASQIHATSGKDKAFASASPNGADRVESVTRGVDDRQAIVTFAKPYAEWRGMLSGNTMLLPKSMTAHARGVQQGSAQRARPVRGTVHHLQPRPHRAANRADPQPEMVGNPRAARQHHLSRARRRRANPRPAEQHHRRHRACSPSTS